MEQRGGAGRRGAAPEGRGGDDHAGHDHGGHSHGGHDHAGHSHAHAHAHVDRAALDRGDWTLSAAVAINILLTAAQVAGGLLAGSIALIADGVHNFSDAAALILAFGARRLARRAPSADYAFGWSRIEVVAALVNYVALVLVVLWLGAEALGRLADPPAVEGWTVVWLAALALVIDLGTAALTWRLAGESLNIRAAFLHNLADAATSVAVIAGGVVILTLGWTRVDPVLTLLISAVLLWHIGKDVPAVVRILMNGAPPGPGAAEIERALAAVPGVAQAHAVKLWALDERRAALQAHLVLEEGADFAAVTRAAKARLAGEFAIREAVIETERAASGCADTISGCADAISGCADTAQR